MESKIANIVRQNPLSGVRVMLQKAAEYDDCISLGIGEPDFDTPEEICRAALKDALDGATHYTQSKGEPELIKEIQLYLNDRLGEDFSPQQIVVTTGATGGLTAFFRAVLEPGDEVLVPEPYYPPYRSFIEWVGGQVVEVRTHFKDDFVPSPQAIAEAITPSTKVLLLNTPHNPTGAVIPAAILDEIARIAVERDLLVLSDEAYERLLFDGRTHQSISTRPGMEERTVVLHSFSKSYAMTGWRVGYAFGPEWVIGPMTKVVGTYTLCAPSVSQRAAVAALRLGSEIVDSMTEAFCARRDQIYKDLKQLPGVKVFKPAGTFYLFPDISEITGDSSQFAFDLLERQQVVVVPGDTFGSSGKGCIRIALTVNRELLSEAIKRIRAFIEGIS